MVFEDDAALQQSRTVHVAFGSFTLHRAFTSRFCYAPNSRPNAALQRWCANPYLYSTVSRSPNSRAPAPAPSRQPALLAANWPALTGASGAHAQTCRLRGECSSHLSTANRRGSGPHVAFLSTRNCTRAKNSCLKRGCKLKSPRLTAWRRSPVVRRLHLTMGRSASRAHTSR